MELTKETRDRIFAAADELFEQNGRDGFPTVDAVRKAARVNMNDASSGMKEWRRAQTAQAAPGGCPGARGRPGRRRPGGGRVVAAICSDVLSECTVKWCSNCATCLRSKRICIPMTGSCSLARMLQYTG